MITVVGSINMDLAVETDIFPRQGETVQGKRFYNNSRRQRGKPGRCGGTTGQPGTHDWSSWK